MNVQNIWIFLAILLGWFALNRWILPAMGVETCMSGGCAVSAGVPETNSKTPIDMGTLESEKQTMNALMEFSDLNFENEVLKSSQPVLVDFSAAWCGPCRMLAPIVEELARENAGSVKVGKIDIDANPRLAAKYGVDSIPSVVIFKDGQVVDMLVGLQPKAKLQDALARAAD